MSFGTLQRDPASGLDFLIEVGTGARIYKHPNCATCGMARWSSGTAPLRCYDGCPGEKDAVEAMFA